ncbi:cadherin-23 [Hylaeus volcanicus]|uniref:cadherin-23 n=1 Tax=Hylaeus volcanicus TaxID=313075 RepID=UPI0023B78FA9|nr:cadherin-23 [Hylaeus volcanicus]XP_053979717.1 cadherin-23 [Hylaeus volcanicus]
MLAVKMISTKPITTISWLLRCYKRRRFKSGWLVFVFICFLSSCSARNNPPRFLTDGQTEIILRLKEGPDTPVGSLIYRLRGVDPDGDSLTFGVRDQPGSDVIRVENFSPNEANIYLNKLLDRETRDEYALVLTLTDGRLGEGNFLTQSLLLLVEDVNDNVPIFRPHPTSLTIREDSGPGVLTTVEAYDADLGVHGQVVYYLQELDGENDVFSVTTINGKGVIRLVGRLDYERKYLYQLRILAIDRAINEKVNTGTTAILVKVQDVEDQPPEFITMTPVARISENARIGTSVLQVRAVDGDKGINNKVTYSITRGPRYLFDIDATSGLVFTRAQLDREAEENAEGAFVLEITVREVSKIVPAPSVSTEVTIILTDVNDETPKFRSTRYRAEINENAPQNTPVNFIGDAIPEVYDHDLGSNGTFRIFIEGDDGMFDVTPFRGINEAPFLIRVKNSSKLDFEVKSEINFTLIAKEVVSVAPKYSMVPVTVFIKDQNDNYPEFTQDIYEVSIPENCAVGTTVAWVQALDEDSGNFGTRGIRYTHLGGSIAHALLMDSLTGVITVKMAGPSFDRELVSRHYLTIEARDDLGKGNQNTVQLIVNVNDVNDNAPVFLHNKYEAVLLENEDRFESPLIIEAFDIDLNGTKNSEVVYAIVSGEFSRNFSIDPKRGIIVPARPLDYEALPISQGHKETSVRPLRLTVRARDAGTPSLSSDAPLIIYLKDINDNAPAFERTLYKRSITEDLAGGTSVVQVKAWDKDLSSPNNKLVYRIQSGAGDKFVISPETGVIRVAPGSNLDPDLTSPKTTRYSLNVLAIDSGTEIQRTAEVLVNITIVDVNNKPPIFIEPGTVTIRENTQVGAYVHRVVANDPDIAPILRYRMDPNSSEARNEEGTLIKIQEYDYLSALELNALDGLLRVVKLIDRERVETIRLGLVVEDLAAIKGVQTAFATLNIIIEDENDNNPRFRRPFYRRSVTENSKNGVNIASIVADDADKNRSITYSLESPKELADLVHLDSETGEMVVANKIDREQYSWLNLTVRATDSGIPPRSSLSEVYVQVLDENDNNPYFVTDISNLTVMENAKIGTEIAVIQAKDSDSGDYGKITYLLDRMSSQGAFAIHPECGALTVADSIDWETKQNYVLVIEAWDNYQFGYTAGESRNAFKQIQVTVTDVNDNPPKMDIPASCITISEFHDVKDLIFVIKAKDADDPTTPNGRVKIRILSGNELGLFILEQTDHWAANLKAAHSLRGKFGNYSLVVEVRDLGSPSNKDTSILNICVTDYNDNPPMFISPQHNTTIRVPENVTVGTQIIQIEAHDADTGPNGDVHFRLKQDLAGHWRTFHIDDISGIISLKLPLDRETQKLYEIRVEAYDLGTPTPLSSDLDLIIYVRNINDYEPQFLLDIFNTNFTEEQLPGSEMVLLPQTVDRDEVDDLDDPPVQVCYFIVGGNDDGLFTLDIYKHELTTAKQLDREQQQQHLLIIKATEDCNTVPANESFYDETTDDTTLKVIIDVIDVNDNPPKFVSKIFTGGVTTDADFGTQFMRVQAIDLDAGENAMINYYQVGKIHMTLTEGLDDIQLQPFLVNKLTGVVSLNFDPQRGMKGYFDFMVIANDTQGLQDSARVFIYLLREDQRVRFVLRQHPPEIRNRIETFRETLGNVTGAIVNIDEYKIHENHDGSVDRTKTDLYLHLVNRRDNSILEVSEVLELVDRNIEKLDTLFKEFNVLDTQAAQYQPIVQYEQAGTTFWLLTLTLFLGALLILCIALCLSQRASFRRQLKAANASPFGTSDAEFIRGPGRVPNTNKHSVEGSNPIWMHAYENEWFKSDESVSHTSERDSLDENALNNEELMNEVNTNQRHEDKPYYIEPRVSSISSLESIANIPNNFHQTSSLHRAHNTIVNPLGKKIETTEL